MPTIKTLFKNLNIEVPASVRDVEISAIHYDSRKVKQGDLFIAVKGFKSDGHTYLESVKDAAAIAAVVEQENPDLDLAQIVVKDSRQIMPYLAYNLYQQKIDGLKLVGITGTNGKTSCAFLIRSVLNAAQVPSGLIGTIAYYYGEKEVPAWNTTPEALDICGMLNEIAEHGQKGALRQHDMSDHFHALFPFSLFLQ
jgi:UDP-N-acetylmuramoyl-L-alanyl-D-glutamate--2,6-diaminopimelate ligase